MIEMLSDNTRRAVSEAENELNTFNFHQQHINRLNEEVDKLNTKISSDQTYLEDLRTQYRIVNASIDDLQQMLLISDRTCAQLYTDLDEIVTLSGWFTEWKNNADGFRMRLTNMYADWQATCKNLDESQRTEAVLMEEIRSAEANKVEATRLLARHRDDYELASKTLQEKHQEFKQLFGESNPEKEEEILQRQIRTAREKEYAVRVQVEAAANQLSLSQGTQHNLVENRLKQQELYREKSSELDLWILRFNGTHSPVQMQELGTIFADTRDWNALRQRIDERKKRKTLSLHNLDMARQELLRLQGSPYRPNPERDETPETLTATSVSLQQRIEELHDQLAALNLKVLAHEKSMALTASYEKQLNSAKENSTEWSRLNLMLGSADGKKFRELAQSYTFGYLVEHANYHLRLLSPRYELRTIPGTLTLEIIDRDMFDERRYVHSLSGGETFVVSLALALGLASLSSNNLAIGSLFIDEGFGNLDEESLQLVMDTLGRLETTQGRKVGVISHTSQIRSQISPQIHLVKLPGVGRSKIEIK